ncbi:hypothetical protein CVT26_006570 [Gymnopilus dilepis]|uniref:Cytochrome b561 domain-containing protein n=1 Tax=Gymnopilus dilepis TaxID=231916 RepID=A0A409Y2R2_9AGAR|nr:hypothetical protein CVT26_006570 [Gymnopilus dilepis]
MRFWSFATLGLSVLSVSATVSAYSHSSPTIFLTSPALNVVANGKGCTLSDSLWQTMCVSAVVNDSVVECDKDSKGLQDVMTSTSNKVGWMAVFLVTHVVLFVRGFGRAMGNSPMIVIWPNSDGSITLSQRYSHGHSTPTVDPNPPRVAQLSQPYTTTSGSTPQLAFTIPFSQNDTKPFVIWAYSSKNPGSSSTDARFNEHDDKGEWQFDLSRPLNSSSTAAGALPSFPPQPLYSYQRLIIAHAIFCILGFLLFLPAGSLIARYLRVFNPVWFKLHWIMQFAIAAPTIVIGVSLGIAAVQEAGALHFGDSHRKYGIGILVLYLAQCALGAFIHFVKNKNRTRRPPQNYLHGLVGLITIGVAMYQVYNGLHSEWQNTTGRGPLSTTIIVIFWLWSIGLFLAYMAGLSLLPRHFRQERASRPRPLRHAFDEDEGYIQMGSQPKLPLNDPQGSYQAIR